MRVHNRVHENQGIRWARVLALQCQAADRQERDGSVVGQVRRRGANAASMGLAEGWCDSEGDRQRDENQPREGQQIAEEGQENDSSEEEEEIIEEISIADLSGVGKKLVDELEGKGLGTLFKIAEATIEDLTQIKGLGKIKAQKMIDEAKKLIEECEEE